MTWEDKEFAWEFSIFLRPEVVPPSVEDRDIRYMRSVVGGLVTVNVITVNKRGW